MKTLYQEIAGQLDNHFPLDWSRALRDRLLTLVLGIVLAESCSPRHMAKALCKFGYSEAAEASLERHLRRIENDERITAEAILHPFARHHLRFGKPDQLVLIIDGTTHTDHTFMLMVSVRYRGRALPLAWDIWEANQPLKGMRFWDRVAQLLAVVASVLPPDVPVIWLADRAFGTSQFTDLLVPYGWHFVVRVQGQTRFVDQAGRESRLDQLIRKRGRFKGTGQVFKSNGWRKLSVVVIYRVQYKGPLCLVTDLAPDWSVVRFYRWRYNIEAMFRDYKSSGWQWEQNQVYDLIHVERLLVGMALATWLSLMAGTQVAHDMLAKKPSGKRRTAPEKTSLFQLGLSRLSQWAVANYRRPLRFFLTDWSAPNWEDQWRNHHAHAFVMGIMSSIVKLPNYLYAVVRP